MAFRDKAFGRAHSVRSKEKKSYVRQRAWKDHVVKQPREAALRLSRAKHAVLADVEPPAAKYFRNRRPKSAGVSSDSQDTASQNSVFAKRAIKPGAWIEREALKYDAIARDVERPRSARHRQARHAVATREREKKERQGRMDHSFNIPGEAAAAVAARRVHSLATAKGVLNVTPIRRMNTGSLWKTDARLEKQARRCCGFLQ